MTLDEWKNIKNDTKQYVLDSTKNFKTYDDWIDWFIKKENLNTQSKIKYFFKKNKINRLECKNLFRYKKCRKCKTYIDFNPLIKNSRWNHYCKECLSLFYKKDYKEKKKRGQVCSYEEIKKYKEIQFKKFENTKKYKILISVVKKLGPSKTNKDITRIFCESNPNLKEYLVKKSVQTIRNEYGIKKLTYIERMTDEERKKYYREERKKYVEKNPDKVAIVNRIHTNKRRKNPIHKISGNLRTRISGIIRSKKFPKNSSLNDIIGCEWDVFEKWFESQFEEGMNFHNYGEVWSIQHIIPLNGIKNESDVYLLNHYKNLKPMFIQKNSSLNDNLLWNDLNDWHFSNKRICELIDDLFKSNKILENYYEKPFEPIFSNKGTLKTKPKRFINNSWKYEILNKKNAIKSAKKVLEGVFDKFDINDINSKSNILK